MESKYKSEEEQIQKAVEWFDAHPGLKYKAVASQFQVPYARFWARCHGTKSKSSCQLHNSRLTEFQENAVVDYINRLAAAFIPPRKDLVVAYAQSLLYDTIEPGVQVRPLGPQWLARFLARHPELHVTKMKRIEKKREQAADVDQIREWFNEYEEVRRQHAIQPSDIWNMDESGFQIGLARDQVVVVPRSDHLRHATKPRIGIPENRESVTVIETISSSGNAIDPWLLMTGKNHVATMYGNGSMLPSDDDGVNGLEAPASWSNDFHIVMTPNGYTNDEIALDWLRHFNTQTAKCQQGRFRLLLVDQHGSHSTRDFVDYCDKNDIILFGFIPHTTHFAQPCDVGIFGSYKHFFTKAVNEGVRSGYTSLAKHEFIHMLATARKQALKESNITSAFKRAGLEPINSQITITAALQTLPQAQTPPQRRENATIVTPKTVRTTTRQGEWLQEWMDDSEEECDDEFYERLETYIRGTNCQSHALRQTMFDLGRTKAAQAAQYRARLMPKYVLQKGGRLRVEDGRSAVVSREKKQAEVDGRRRQRRLFKSLADPLDGQSQNQADE